MSQHFDNLFLTNTVQRVDYTTPRSKGQRFKTPPRTMNHGVNIRRQFDLIWNSFQEELNRRRAASLQVRDGVYLEFESSPGYELKTKSLEDLRAGIRLLNIRNITLENSSTVQRATIFVPYDRRSYFLKKIDDYIENGRNKDLINSIEQVRQAVLESFWIGNLEWMPNDEPIWCEIWLSCDKQEVVLSFREVLASRNISIKQESIRFPERTVVLAKVHRNHLMELIQISPHIAEFRRAPETARFFVEEPNREQREWVEDVLRRLEVISESNVSVCILDTGVSIGHPLLQPLLKESDLHAYDLNWGVQDHEGHGTEMAGIAAYGDLQQAVISSDAIQIPHKLESVKILPPTGENDPELYGAITSQAISKTEIQRPNYQRIHCMAVTTDVYSPNDGVPDSWSSAIDEIASGYMDDKKRLIFISAGNIKNQEDYLNYPASNMTCRVQSPGQAWNAVTVGAYTEKDTLTDPDLADSQILAPRQGLSPFSTTSVLWEPKWPIKPEILLEGGNLIKDCNACLTCDDLSVLTTYFKPIEHLFTISGQTSAATAQAAWMAAQLQFAYPQAWPETIRGLMIHSAEWTPKMIEQFLPSNPKKSHYHQLLRTCGYGVPRLERAQWCFQNSVNMIVQETLQPFERDGSNYRTKDMHIHQLPWPKEVLLDLGERTVRMRVTLSYFIEPSPGEVGWKDRYRYPSCALRFDVNNVNEDLDNFNRRLNAAARDENEYDSDSGSNRWLIGKNIRHRGSIHSDIWEGAAAELATSNLIGIYPAIGWWRERHQLGRWNKQIRYSLIVTLSTEAENVDLYTPIINIIRTSIPVEI